MKIKITDLIKGILIAPLALYQSYPKIFVVYLVFYLVLSIVLLNFGLSLTLGAIAIGFYVFSAIIFIAAFIKEARGNREKR